MCKNKRLHIHELIEGVDFYWEEVSGVKYRIFTEEYLKVVRPVCCKTSCRHCPFKED